MTEPEAQPVTVVGLGAMGSALAGALLAAGHPTTVWNRTAARTEPLTALGARAVGDIGEAVRAAPLVVTCLTTYDATLEALTPASEDLGGRTLITLNSGAPSGARSMAAWAEARGARFLDGAVKNVPSAVGRADTLLYYSGDREVFDAHLPTLQVFGGDTQHLGGDVDLAALYESAVGGTLLPALLGFFQGAALVTARGLTAESLVPHTVKWLEMINALLPDLASEIDSGNYQQPQSALGLFHAAIPDERQLGAEAGIDIRWLESMHDLLQRGVDLGYGDLSISVLVEVLRQTDPAS
jgi:3-hydroxyisobutyrate dehydrogenase-like beta-hydroxyacid dehydrogenase